MRVWPLIAAMAFTLPARAQVADTAEAFGLLGAWAADCRQSPTPSNPYTLFAKTGQGVLTALQTGDDAPAASGRLTGAEIQGDRIRLRDEVSMGASRFAVDSVAQMGRDGRIRIVVSQVAGGQVLVSGGTWRQAVPGHPAGSSTPWLQLCRPAVVS